MGACCSFPETLPQASSTSAAQSSRLPALAHSGADPGLTKSHTYVQPLGVGSTGDIAEFVDMQTQQHVAIKLIRRPVPRVIALRLMQEILVHMLSFCNQNNLALPCTMHCSRPTILKIVSFKSHFVTQIQAEMGKKHINIVEAKEVMLTNAHLCLVMEVGFVPADKLA